MKLVKLVAFIGVMAAPLLIAQQPAISNSPSTTPPGFSNTDTGPFTKASQERLEKGRQSERQKRLQADTDRLLALATQLKADMDKTTKDTLSIDVIKKAEEIEKLAKSVKERMKG